jgi:hypothetical protein
VTIAIRPSLSRRDGVTIIIILKNGRKIFLQKGLDRNSQGALAGQISLSKSLIKRANSLSAVYHPVIASVSETIQNLAAATVWIASAFAQ